MGGKSKGSEWERQICKELSVWIQGTEKPYLFWRTPLSGGMATISELNKDMSGDIRSISPKSEWWPFSVECKTGYPKTSFWQHFKNIKNFNIKDFWVQCTEDAKKPGKYPMLIYRKKNQKPIVGINKIVDNLLRNKIKKLNSMEICWIDLESVTFYNMKDFFEVVNPNDIKGLLKNEIKCD